MKYLYGPVKSRRLGLSLGITLTPFKVCTFSCVYCQLGNAGRPTAERREYIPLEDISEELRLWLINNPGQAKELDYITLSGCGEPTLNVNIGRLIGRIRRMTTASVALITNASLLADAAIRSEVLGADLIVPSLDAVTGVLFEKIDRPAQGIDINGIISGLIELRKEFKGKIWLEVMLVKGLNDDIAHIRKLKEIADKIGPDKIQLNSPVRSTAEAGVFPVEKKKLEKIREILGEKCEIL